MSEYFQDMDMVREIMRGTARRLMAIAHSLDTVGNERLADKIAEEAELLDSTQTRLRDAVIQKLTKDHDEAARGFGQILTFLLHRAEPTP